MTRSTFAATYAAILADAAKADPGEYGIATLANYTAPRDGVAATPAEYAETVSVWAETVARRMTVALDRGSASVTQSPALRKAARRCGLPDTQAAFYAAWKGLPA